MFISDILYNQSTKIVYTYNTLFIKLTYAYIVFLDNIVVNLCFTCNYWVYLGKAISLGLRCLTIYSIYFKTLIKRTSIKNTLHNKRDNTQDFTLALSSPLCRLVN